MVIQYLVIKPPVLKGLGSRSPSSSVPSPPPASGRSLQGLLLPPSRVVPTTPVISPTPPCKIRYVKCYTVYLTGEGVDTHTPTCKIRHQYTLCTLQGEVSIHDWKSRAQHPSQHQCGITHRHVCAPPPTLECGCVTRQGNPYKTRHLPLDGDCNSGVNRQC